MSDTQQKIKEFKQQLKSISDQHSQNKGALDSCLKRLKAAGATTIEAAKHLREKKGKERKTVEEQLTKKINEFEKAYML